VGEMREVIPCAMGLVLAFIVARVHTTRMRASLITVASVGLGFLATQINHESLAHIWIDIPQVAFATVVGLALLGRYLPTWVKSEATIGPRS
jgi:hypothetical protein